jgi:hypothetical protein
MHDRRLIRRALRRCLDMRGEEGQLVMGLVILASIMAVFAMGIMLLPLGAASTERSAAQAAADAAALAGADEMGAQWRGQLTINFTGLDELFRALKAPGSCGAGRPEADTFAQRNGAALTAYCAEWPHGTASATVRMRGTAISGTGAQARATASVGFDPALCVVPADFPPKPTPTPTPTPTPSSSSSSTSSSTTTTTPPPPPPPADAEADIDCGPVSLHVAFDGKSHNFRLSPTGQLDDLFDPRLVR